MTITEVSIKRPSLIFVIFTVLGLLGLFSYSQLQYELLPKMSPPIVTITTVYPGASPSEVENSVSKVIEDAVSGMDKVSVIRSTSSEGVSFVVIELVQSAKVDLSLQDALRKVTEVQSKLPSGVKAPVVSKIALDEIPVLRLGVNSNMNKKDFTQVIKNSIIPAISKISGVGQVVILGGEEREIKINLDRQKLQSYGISVLQVTNVIKASNLDFPTGKIEDKDGQYVVRLAGKFSSIDMIRDLPVGLSKSGGIVKLSEIAEVQDGVKDMTNAIRFNLKPTISLYVQKQSDANAVEVSALVKKKLKDLETQYKQMGLNFIIAQDAATFTIEAADAVKFDLFLAVVLVAMVMLMFLHSIRNSVIVMIAIPASLISTFTAMYALNFTLNLMTLLGLSLVVGILVDDSIVVLENIYHHLEKGEERRTAAIKGRNEIGFAALAITLVDVSVFLPLALVSGIIGNILRQFAGVVVISTLLSLFVSFTITPMLASRFAKVERLTDRTLLGRFALYFERFYERLSAFYLRTLRWALGHKKTVLIGAVIAFFASIALIPLGFIGSEFIAQTDRGEFAVTLEAPSGYTLEQTDRLSFDIEKMIAKLPEVDRVFSNAGVSSEGLLGFNSNNSAEINVTLVPAKLRTKTTDEISIEIKNMISKIPGIKVRVNPIGIFGVANQTPIAMLIYGTNYDQVMKGAKIVMDAVKTVPGTADVRLSAEEGKPETRIIVDRDKLNNLGLTIADVGTTLRVALAGDEDAKFRDLNDEYTIRIQFDKFDRSRTTDLQNIMFFNRMGKAIELNQFAQVIRTTGPTKLQREDRNPSVILYSQALGRPSGTISQDIEKVMKDTKLPDGVVWSFSGDVKNQKESFASLGLAFLAALIFTYLIMVALYDNFVYPFVVLFSVPLAMIGALLAMALAGKALGIFSILGIIMLIGLVGKNAILLVDRANDSLSKGIGVYDALIDAGKMRLRPILMTTLTMIFGMLPIALSKSAGAEWKTGLAWALIGGLTSSLILTLVVVPVIYDMVEKLRVKFSGRIQRMLE